MTDHLTTPPAASDPVEDWGAFRERVRLSGARWTGADAPAPDHEPLQPARPPARQLAAALLASPDRALTWWEQLPDRTRSWACIVLGTLAALAFAVLYLSV